MHISGLSEDEKQLSNGVWLLLQQLGDKDRLPQMAVGGPKCVRRVLHAKHIHSGPNREPYYYFTAGNKQRVRSWFSDDGRLTDPDSFAIALSEVKAKAAKKRATRQAKREMNGVIAQASRHPTRYKPPVPVPGVRDMLSAYRSKVLSEQ